MMAEWAVLLLCIAIVAACLSVVTTALAARFPITHATDIVQGSALFQCFGVASAFFLLILLNVESDFSVSNVAQYSHTLKPLIYKITGTWGNHEGSILLWALVLAGFGALFALNYQNLPELLLRYTLAVQSVILAGTLLFIVFVSNPFTRLVPAPLEGKSLNPLLQDIGLALHPPTLYMGYVGYALVFSLAVASLLYGKMPTTWAHFARPWALLSWIPLTIGIGMGSWWAYRELGWGGWWFWDPVENASLIPWLAGTALMHSLIVLEKRHIFARWTLLLAILTFTFSLLGTFLVRSGVLTSVHAFAHDPARGMFILCYLVVVSGGALTLFALRYDSIQPADEPTTAAPLALLSREHLLLLNNILLVVSAAVVLIGTLYPLAMQVLHLPPVSVGPPYYAITFLPIALPLVVLAGVAVHVPWGGQASTGLRQKMIGPLVAALAAAALGIMVLHQDFTLGVIGFALAAFLLFSTAQLAVKWWQLPQRSTRQFGMIVAHIGFALFVGAATANQLMKVERETLISANETVDLVGWKATLTTPQIYDGPNYKGMVFPLTLSPTPEQTLTLYPEYRLYGEGQETKEAAIDVGVFGDWYATLSPLQNESLRWLLRVHQEPAILWVWLGLALAGVGGVCCFITSIIPWIRKS